MPQDKFNPASDNIIYQKFTKKTIENKRKNKEAFCEEADLPFDKKVPLICVTYPLSDINNVGMLQDIMNGILEQPVQLVATKIGTSKYQKFFTDLSNENPQKIILVDNNEEEKRKIYAASDIMIVCSDSEECINEAKKAMNYGIVTIILPTDFTEDYNPNLEKGNAFVYLKNSPWNLFATFIRAIETFRFPYDWKNIAANAMSQD